MKDINLATFNKADEWGKGRWWYLGAIDCSLSREQLRKLSDSIFDEFEEVINFSLIGDDTHVLTHCNNKKTRSEMFTWLCGWMRAKGLPSHYQGK